MSTAATTKKQIETLTDGASIEVTGRDNGTVRSVKVRKLSILDIGKLARASTRGEADEIAIYLDLPITSLTQFSDESLEAILEEGRRLNFPQCRRYWARQRQLNEVITSEEDRAAVLNEAIRAATQSTETAQT